MYPKKLRGNPTQKQLRSCEVVSNREIPANAGRNAHQLALFGSIREGC